jgi:chemotaxis protein CheD
MTENTLTARKTLVWEAPAAEFSGRTIPPAPVLPEIYLHPGQCHVAPEPAVLKMILGSCAGVFLFDRFGGVGGAAHFMLPHRGEGPPHPRYGDVAIAGLLEGFRAHGSRPANIQARIFGGAGMLQALEGLSGPRIGQIGRRNIEVAIELLERASILIVEKSVFGNQARKVSMVSNTGEAALEFVSNDNGNR